MENTQDRLIRYLEDAWAVENGLVENLKEMADSVNDAQIHTLFMQHRAMTLQHRDRLEARLRSLGKEPSGSKGFIAHMLGKIGDALHISHDSYDKTVQNLMRGYASEHFEVAMYEALEAYAEKIGDLETADLAHVHKVQEQEAAQELWHFVAPASIKVSEMNFA